MSFLTSLRPSILRNSLAAVAPTSRAFSSSPRSALSKFSIIGRLAAPVEIITTSSGRELCRYALGTNHGHGEHKATSWWKVAAFLPDGPQRDTLMSLGKG